MTGTWAYFDDSGTHDGSPLTLYAGVLATPMSWTRIVTHWSKVLSDSGVSDFHGNELEGGHKEFAGWARQRRTEFVTQLTNILTREHEARDSLYVVWAGVRPDQYDRIAEDFPKPKLTALQYCFEVCARNIMTLSVEHPEIRPVGIYVPTGQSLFVGRIKELQDSLHDENIQKIYGIDGIVRLNVCRQTIWTYSQ